ncbi:type IV pilus modification protein PilV [Acinetobacter brisouii]
MKNQKQQGFTLLEALIAMFITASALLGLGILHLKSVQQSQLATQRTIANIQANDLIDRMWANVCSLSTQQTGIITGWQSRWDPTQAGTLDSNQSAMHQLLKNWQGTVTQPDTTKQRYQVVITWTNAKAAWYSSTPLSQRFTYNFTLPTCAS